MAFLFNGGYSQKTYDKNSIIIKNRLEGIMMECAGEMGIGKVLNSIIFKLEQMPYPKSAKGKELSAVDERIIALLDTMERDAQNKSFALLSAHADMLASAIMDSRKYGQERYNADELTAQSKMADCKGSIYQQLVEKSKMAEKKKALLAQGKKAQEMGDQAMLQRVRLEYNECDAAEKACDTAIEHYSKIYNASVAVVNRRKIGRVAHELQDMHITTPAQFAKEEAMTNELLSKAMDQADEIMNIANESNTADATRIGASATNDAFSDAMAADAFGDMSSSIEGATVNVAAAQAVNDPFATALNQNK